MTLDNFITRSAVVASILWAAGGAIEIMAGNGGRACVFAGVAAFALIVEVAWRVLRSAAQRP